MIKTPAKRDFIPAIYLNGLNKMEIIGYLFLVQQFYVLNHPTYYAQ